MTEETAQELLAAVRALTDAIYRMSNPADGGASTIPACRFQPTTPQPFVGGRGFSSSP